MKRSKIAFYFLAVLALLFLAGCTDSPAAEDGSQSSESTGSSPSDGNTPEPSKSTVPGAEEIPVHVDYATDETLSQYPSYIDEYVEYEYAIKIILITDAAVKEFRYIKVDYNFDDDNVVFLEGETLHSMDEWLPEQPLVASTDFPGIFPTTGITFVDANDVKRCFYINVSGKDGSLSLVEF